MLKNSLRLFLISTVINLFFIAFIHNIDFSERIITYICIIVFYSCLFVGCAKYNVVTKPQLFLMLFIVPFVIDASVIVTAPSFIPLRFPFETTFTLLGLILGFLFLKKEVLLFLITLFGSATYCYISWKIIIPTIIFSMENAQVVNFEQSFIRDNFITPQKDTIVLKELFKKCTIIDFFFVGCAPCEEKRKMFYDLSEKELNDEYNIVLICNGAISSFEHFVSYWETLPAKRNINFIYDYGGSIKRSFNNLNKYPFEIIYDSFDEVKTFAGFNPETYRLNMDQRIELIERITNSNKK